MRGLKTTQPARLDTGGLRNATRDFNTLDVARAAPFAKPEPYTRGSTPVTVTNPATLADIRAPRSACAAALDRLADAELQHGHYSAAERLAWRAAELRGMGR